MKASTYFKYLLIGYVGAAILGVSFFAGFSVKPILQVAIVLDVCGLFLGLIALSLGKLENDLTN